MLGMKTVEMTMERLRRFAYAGLAVTLLTAASCSSSAQIDRPRRYTSPPAHTEAVIGGAKITVDYYSPSMRGRKIFGKLVPFNQVWCTGANYATDITSDADIQMGSLKVPKGSHSIWTIPTETDWTLIINNRTGQFHLDYDELADLGRTKMNVKTLPAAVETFRIDVRPDGEGKGILALDWETTEAYMPFVISR